MSLPHLPGTSSSVQGRLSVLGKTFSGSLGIGFFSRCRWGKGVCGGRYLYPDGPEDGHPSRSGREGTGVGCRVDTCFESVRRVSARRDSKTTGDL